MVVGIDSFHDISRGRRSIGGFVSSTNPELTRWYSQVCIQMQGEELVPGLRMFMVAAIRKYYEVSCIFVLLLYILLRASKYFEVDMFVPLCVFILAVSCTLALYLVH